MKNISQLPAFSIHPESASVQDIAEMAAELMLARNLLHQVHGHMCGKNMDGTRRPWPGDEGCAQNWQKLADAILIYFENNEP